MLSVMIFATGFAVYAAFTNLVSPLAQAFIRAIVVGPLIAASIKDGNETETDDETETDGEEEEAMGEGEEGRGCAFGSKCPACYHSGDTDKEGWSESEEEAEDDEEGADEADETNDETKEQRELTEKEREAMWCRQQLDSDEGMFKEEDMHNPCSGCGRTCSCKPNNHCSHLMYRVVQGRPIRNVLVFVGPSRCAPIMRSGLDLDEVTKDWNGHPTDNGTIMLDRARVHERFFADNSFSLESWFAMYDPTNGNVCDGSNPMERHGEVRTFLMPFSVYYKILTKDMQVEYRHGCERTIEVWYYNSRTERRCTVFFEGDDIPLPLAHSDRPASANAAT